MMDSNGLIAVVLAVGVFCYEGECLVCYSCSPSSSRDSVSANLNCLANSTEITCRLDQDRCFSLTTGISDVRVEKGCTTSERCLGNRICCSQDFCNAGQSSVQKTGYGKMCSAVTDCVQGADDMTCSARSQRDVTRVCMCRESRYTQGAVCRSMSRVGGQCFKDEHCLPVNSFCEYNLCRCGHYFYANDTICRLKVGLSAPCTENIQCRPNNSECVGGLCVCKPGYDTFQDTGICSGSCVQTSLFLLLASVICSRIQHG